MEHRVKVDERLLYRRQFVLGAETRNVPASWQEVRLSSDLIIKAHPSLDVVHVSADSTSVTLPGMVVDSLRQHLDRIGKCIFSGSQVPVTQGVAM